MAMNSQNLPDVLFTETRAIDELLNIKWPWLSCVSDTHVWAGHWHWELVDGLQTCEDGASAAHLARDLYAAWKRRMYLT